MNGGAGQQGLSCRAEWCVLAQNHVQHETPEPETIQPIIGVPTVHAQDPADSRTPFFTEVAALLLGTQIEERGRQQEFRGAQESGVENSKKSRGSGKDPQPERLAFQLPSVPR
ncbi:hypothetical protein PR202_gb13576 [Eleusine coracana subsp. coracana]|uniref:Uncharacterized protein n=1 Tax=Eleusine coracana subsp. coracana TaxID=191504 RepID=A0AAV5ESD8_ELECO|nr:hypothetical protein PR202_gb13576 [Eleusine coracana subsp. coracana]